MRVADRDAIEDAQAFWDEVEREEASLEGRGRVLVRPSGTEPLVRVMVEAPTQDEADQVAGPSFRLGRARTRLTRSTLS